MEDDSLHHHLDLAIALEQAVLTHLYMAQVKGLAFKALKQKGNLVNRTYQNSKKRGCVLFDTRR